MTAGAGEGLGIEPELLEYDIHHASEAWKYEHDPFNVQESENVAIIQYEEYTVIDQVQVTTQYGTREFTPAQWRKMKQVLESNGVPYQAKRMKGRQYAQVFVVGNQVAEARVSPYQEGFTFQFLTGKRDRNKNQWFGIGRMIRDPQLWTNKLFSTILHALASGSKGGLMAEESAFADPQKAEEEYASPDSITWSVVPDSFRRASPAWSATP